MSSGWGNYSCSNGIAQNLSSILEFCVFSMCSACRDACTLQIKSFQGIAVILTAQVDQMKVIPHSKNYLGEVAELDIEVGAMSEGRCASA